MFVHPVNYQRSAKPHNAHRSLVIGYTIYFGFEWLAVPFVFVYDLGAQAAYRDVYLFCRPAYGAGSSQIVRKDQLKVIGQESLTLT